MTYSDYTAVNEFVCVCIVHRQSANGILNGVCMMAITCWLNWVKHKMLGTSGNVTVEAYCKVTRPPEWL